MSTDSYNLTSSHFTETKSQFVSDVFRAVIVWSTAPWVGKKHRSFTENTLIHCKIVLETKYESIYIYNIQQK